MEPAFLFDPYKFAVWGLGLVALAAVVIGAAKTLPSLSRRHFNEMGATVLGIFLVVLLCVGGLKLIPGIVQQVFKVGTGRDLPAEVQFGN